MVVKGKRADSGCCVEWAPQPQLDLCGGWVAFIAFAPSGMMKGEGPEAARPPAPFIPRESSTVLGSLASVALSPGEARRLATPASLSPRDDALGFELDERRAEALVVHPKAAA